jgi:probable HAF family extracellular repeat protein
VIRLFIAVILASSLSLRAYAYEVRYTVTDLGSLAGPTSGADFINNNGWVAGQADVDSVFRYAHAWIWTGSGALQNLGSFGGPQSVSIPTGLNDNGWVVGQSDISNGGATHGFLWTGGGTIQDIGGFGGQNTIPLGINDAGVIVGSSQKSDGTYGGFTWSNGVMSAFGAGLIPTCISNSGQIAGGIVAADGSVSETHGFIVTAGTVHDIGTLGGSAAYVNAINGNGLLTGESYTASGQLHAFVYSNTIQDIGTLGGPDSYGYGINSSGVLVGTAQIDSARDTRAFVYASSAGMVDLNSLIDPSSGWILTAAESINNTGDIVGTGINAQGQQHAFLLTPTAVPVPQSVSLLAFGAAFIFANRYRLNNAERRQRVTWMPKKAAACAILTSCFFLNTACVRAYEIKYTVTDLGSLAGPTSVATYINNNGWVAGWADDDPVFRYAHAWVWTGSGALQNLGSFGGPKSVSIPTGINDNGWVVGQSDISSGGATHGFLWAGGGTIQDIGTLGGDNTIPQGINNAGTIVGSSQTSSGTYDGFSYSNGVMTDLGPTFIPAGINNSGQLISNVEMTPGNVQSLHAFLSSGGTFQDLGTLGGSFAQANALNDVGTVVGFSLTSSGSRHAFVFTDHIIDLGTLGGPSSAASGVNLSGTLVGGSNIDSAQDNHGFVYSAATGMVDLNTLIDPALGWDIQSAAAINNSGQIAASGINPDGLEHAVLLTPIDVPEPNSVLLVVFATLATCGFRTRRR